MDRYKVTTIGTKPEWDWFREQVPFSKTEDSRGIMARIDGEPAAALVICNVSAGSAELHQCIVNQDVLMHSWPQDAAGFAFGKHRLTVYGLVPANNQKAVMLNRALGCEVTGIIPNGAARGVDYLLMSVARHDCKYVTE